MTERIRDVDTLITPSDWRALEEKLSGLHRAKIWHDFLHFSSDLVNLRPEKRAELVVAYLNPANRWVMSNDLSYLNYPTSLDNLMMHAPYAKTLLGNDLRSIGISRPSWMACFEGFLEPNRGDWQIYLPRAYQFTLLYPEQRGEIKLREEEIADIGEWILGYEDIKHGETGDSLFYDWFLGYVGELRVVAGDEAITDLVSRVSYNKVIQELDTWRRNFDRDGQARFTGTALSLKIIFADKIEVSEFGLEIK